MNGISWIGKEICEFATTQFSIGKSAEICALPSVQNLVLVGAVGAAFSAATLLKYTKATLQNRMVQPLPQQDPIAMSACGNRKGIQQYIASGGDVNFTDSLENTLLMLACENGHYGIVQDLLAANADSTLTKYGSETALHMACSGRHYEIVCLLLEKGDNVNAQDSQGITPLMVAAAKGHAKIVQVLIEKGSDLNAATGEKETALHAAAKEHPDVVRLLLEASADPDVADKYGVVPLHHAVHQECVGAIEALLEKTKNPNAQDKEGNTPLHLTAESTHDRLKSAEALLKNPKINPNVLNKEGNTPLHMACYGITGNHDLALLMIRSGRCDLSIQSSGEKKETVQELAKRLDAKKVLEALQEKQGVSPVKEGELLPEGATWENGEKIEQRNIEQYSKEELEKIRVEELPLMEWAVAQDHPKIVNALNSKGIYFQFNEQNEERLFVAFLKGVERGGIKDYSSSSYPNILELKQNAAVFRDFLAHPEKDFSNLPEYVELWIEVARMYFRQAQVIARHKQKGTHVYGSEYMCGNIMKMGSLLREILPFVPPHVRQEIERPTHPSMEEMLDRFQIPEQLRPLLRRERTLEEIFDFWPSYKEIMMQVVAEERRPL